MAALLAFGISTVSGGGAGLLVPVLPTSVVPVALTVATSTVSKLALFRRPIAWTVTRRFVPEVLLGACLTLVADGQAHRFKLLNFPLLLVKGQR